MKKIGIITYHKHNNYGAVLQAYALQEKIKSMGYDVEIINYKYKNNKFSLNILKNKGIINYILGILGPVTRLPRAYKFFIFRKYFSLSPKYNKDTIKLAGQRYDLCFSGSDNVWNAEITNFDKNYFLNFISDPKKKYSYASSFGSSKIPEDLRSEYTKLLNSYNMLNTREESGAQLIKSLTNKKANVVVDPTLLLEKKEWNKLAIAPKEVQKYLLAYQMVPSKKFIQLVNRISKKESLKVIYIPFPMGKVTQGKWKFGLSPQEWLGYIKYADKIVTDSFHGVIFSIIFQKEFYVVLTQLSTRIENILSKIDLNNRIIENITGYEQPKINYDNIKIKLKQLISNSNEVLKKCLENS